MRHLSCDSRVEIIGQNVLSWIDNMAADEVRPYLLKYNLAHVEPNTWYPAARLLDLLNDMAETANLSSSLVAIGMAISNTVVLPPELEHASLAQILELWGQIYLLQHRGPNLGNVVTEKISDKSYKTTHTHIYPDDMSYGVAYGFAKRFLPRGTDFTIKYDEKTPRLDQGGNATIIYASWR